MIIGILESQYRKGESFLAIQIKNKNGRFVYNSKKIKSISQITDKKNYYWEVLEEVSIDKRDENILNEFIDYVNGFNFEIQSNCRQYSIKNDTFYHFWGMRIMNGNFKKFKDYIKKNK
jgi:hypothetical protein